MKIVDLAACSLLGMALATVTIATARAEGAPVPVRVPSTPFVITQPLPQPPTVTLPEPTPQPLPVITQPVPQPPTILLPQPDPFGVEDVPAPVISGEPQPQPAPTVQSRPGQATFILHSEDRYILGVEFFSENRANWTWPGNGREYTLSGTQVYPLSCNNGEQICAGAWRDNQTVAWGVGHGNRGCQACCLTCGGQPLELTLNDGGPDSFPAQGQNINEVVGVIAAIVNGLSGAGSGLVGPGCQASLGC